MIGTRFVFIRYGSLALACVLLATTVQAQDQSETPSAAENTGPTTDVGAGDSFPLNRAADGGESGTFETGTNSDEAGEEGAADDAADEYSSTDREQSNNEDEVPSYLEELAVKYSDTAFDRYVNFAHLHSAFAANDISALVDVILGLAHAENVVQRTHSSGVTADDLVRRLGPFLARADEKQLGRLERGAAALGKDWKEQFSSAREFASQDRSPAPAVSLENISNSKMAVYSAYADALREAEMANNQEDIRALLGELAKAEGLSEAEKEFLSASRSGKATKSKDDPAGELLREFSSASRESSNRNQVRSNLSRGWSVIWGKNFTEADWARGLKAIAESIAAENPGPFLAWFSSVIDENFAKIQRNLPGVARRDIERWIVQSLDSKRIVTYRGLRIQAGFATYNRWKRVVYDEPRTRQKRVSLPFGGWTYVPEVYTHRVEKRIPLPNWHQFYIRYQLVPSGGGGGGGGGGSTGGGREYKIWIENPYSHRINYKINGESFYVDGNRTRWHSRRGNSAFNVEFDWSFSDGYQRRGYRLTPGSRNYFSKVGNGLDLYRR